MNESVLQKWAKPMLLAAPIIWGSAFVVMKHSLDSFTPLYLLAFRFTAAALILALVFWRSWRRLDRGYLLGGLATGTLLFLAYAFQTFGLEGTTAGKNASLTAVYCVIVSFLNWAVARKRSDKWNILAAVVCIAGIGLVTLPGEGGDLTMGLGDARLALAVAVGRAGRGLYACASYQVGLGGRLVRALALGGSV